MKRLLRISFDLALLSIFPIISWIMLSIIVDVHLINIFTIMYPLQFIWYIIKSIFSTGANVSEIKDRNSSAVMSGFVIGSILGIIVFSLICFNIESYINFMNMDGNIYKIYAIYYVIQLFIKMIFSFVINKLYFSDKNKLANKFSLIFNLINFIVLLLSAIFIKNSIIVITITLLSIFLYTLYIAIKFFEKFTFKLNIVNCIKYDIVELFDNIMFFFIFFFGFSNVLSYENKYVIAMTFVALITDAQWDIFESISIVAKIDISLKKFNYKMQIKNAYKLLVILLFTIISAFLIFNNLYNLNILIVFIFMSFVFIDFILYPLYKLKTIYLQLEYSPIKTTVNTTIANGFHLLISIIRFPFCTALGQNVASFYQFIVINSIFNKNYIINQKGEILEKRGE